MKHKNKHTPATTPPITEQDIDAVAIELDALAKSKLRDGCLSGCLSGNEPEIRQEATLIALGWWVDHQERKSGDWIPKKCISYALRFAKGRQIELQQRRKEHPYNALRDTRMCEHPQRLHPHEYPERSLLRMLDDLITKCLLAGSISNSNVVIARMSYMEGMTIGEIARAMRISPSAVNQQLQRVRQAVRKQAKTTDPIFSA